MAKTLKEVARVLLDKNAELTTLVVENDKSYKLIEAKVSPRLVASIGRQEGTYIKRNELIWAIIDEAKGSSEEELDY